MKKLLIPIIALLLMFGAGCSKEEKMCVMNVASYNLRMDTPHDSLNAWPYRKELVKDLVRFHDFDIFGTQEGFKHMLDGIAELPEYTWIGEGRDGGDKGEHSAIFFKKDRFTVLDSGNFWYSETPDKVGLGWDATCCNRICSWGKFKDNISGKEFFFFSSHFDHQGVVARRESAKLLLGKIKEIVGDGIVFSTGDYNARPEDEPMKILLNDGLLKDSYVITERPPYGTEGTYHGYKKDAPMKSRIDFILVSNGVRVKKYGTLNELPYGKFPSDHFPVMIVAEF